MKRPLAVLAIPAVLAVSSCAEARSTPRPKLKQPEIGIVKWQRDFDGALARSKKSGKPVFAFFQEVPGCAGCREFGSTVLTHPLVVAGIESEFVPVLIYNNRASGEDPKILKRFKEPAWNYQVIRFLDGNGADIIPRKDRVWTTGPLLGRMIATLEKSRRDVPEYLRLALAEADTANHARSAFAQHCFWTGELKLGQIEGVIATEAGWLEGREVTLVTWDKSKLDYKDLYRQASAARCADKAYEKVPEGYRAAKKSDQKRQLADTPFARLALTPAQATKVNAFARTDSDKARTFLTPEQRKRL